MLFCVFVKRLYIPFQRKWESLLCDLQGNLCLKTSNRGSGFFYILEPVWKDVFLDSVAKMYIKDARVVCCKYSQFSHLFEIPVIILVVFPRPNSLKCDVQNQEVQNTASLHCQCSRPKVLRSAILPGCLRVFRTSNIEVWNTARSTGSIRDLTGAILDLTGAIPDLTGSIRDLIGAIPDLRGSIRDLKFAKKC